MVTKVAKRRRGVIRQPGGLSVPRRDRAVARRWRGAPEGIRTTLVLICRHVCLQLHIVRQSVPVLVDHVHIGRNVLILHVHILRQPFVPLDSLRVLCYASLGSYLRRIVFGRQPGGICIRGLRVSSLFVLPAASRRRLAFSQHISRDHIHALRLCYRRCLHDVIRSIDLLGKHHDRRASALSVLLAFPICVRRSAVLCRIVIIQHILHPRNVLVVFHAVVGFPVCAVVVVDMPRLTCVQRRFEAVHVLPCQVADVVRSPLRDCLQRVASGALVCLCPLVKLNQTLVCTALIRLDHLLLRRRMLRGIIIDRGALRRAARHRRIRRIARAGTERVLDLARQHPHRLCAYARRSRRCRSSARIAREHDVDIPDGNVQALLDVVHKLLLSGIVGAAHLRLEFPNVRPQVTQRLLIFLLRRIPLAVHVVLDGVKFLRDLVILCLDLLARRLRAPHGAQVAVHHRECKRHSKLRGDLFLRHLPPGRHGVHPGVRRRERRRCRRLPQILLERCHHLLVRQQLRHARRYQPRRNRPRRAACRAGKRALRELPAGHLARGKTARALDRLPRRKRKRRLSCGNCRLSQLCRAQRRLCKRTRRRVECPLRQQRHARSNADLGRPGNTRLCRLRLLACLLRALQRLDARLISCRRSAQLRHG